MILLSCAQNKNLSKKIVDLGIKPVIIEKYNFANQELYIRIKEDIKGKDVYVLGSTNLPHVNLMEMLLVIRSAQKGNAKKITAIIPYFGYGRQSEIFNEGEAGSANLMADLILKAGADNILVLDPHSPKLKKYLKTKLGIIDPEQIFSSYLKNIIDPKDFVVAAPDFGAKYRAQKLAKLLHIKNTTVCKKVRYKTDKVKITKCLGSVAGKNCLIVDDEISTGGTIIKSCRMLKKNKAKNIYVLVTHAVCRQGQLDKLLKEDIKQIIFTDSIERHFKKDKRVKILTCAKAITDKIKE